MPATAVIDSGAPVRGGAEGAATLRQALLQGMSAAFAEHGYWETEMAQLAASTGRSEAELRELFGNREDCLVAVCEAEIAAGRKALAQSAIVGSEWSARLRAGLAALLERVSANPVGAWVVLSEGERCPRTRRQLEASFEAIAAFLRGGRAASDTERPDLERGLIGGARWTVLGKLAAGEGHAAGELRQSLELFLLSPYQEVASRAAPKSG